MSIIDTAMIFVGGFASVFTLGFQSRAVNAGNFMLAACMSFLIAMSQAHLWTLIVKSDGDILGAVTYGISGMCAITSAMWLHQRFFTRRAEEKKHRVSQ